MYTGVVRNVTFSADEQTIQLARERAARENRSLNDVVRQWLREYAQPEERVRRFHEIMEDLKDLKLSPPYTREEMNRRR